jgi:hypothetical protein
MSYDPNNPHLPENNPPTPEQLIEFRYRIKGLIDHAAFPRFSGYSVSARYLNPHSGITTIGLGQNIINMDPAAVDINIHKALQPIDRQIPKQETYEEYVYSPTDGKTYYDKSSKQKALTDYMREAISNGGNNGDLHILTQDLIVVALDELQALTHEAPPPQHLAQRMLRASVRFGSSREI